MQRLTRLLVTASLMAAGAAHADVPRAFSFQGRLAGYANETVGITVRLYDAPTGGTQLFAEMNPATLKDGVFSITVGSVSGVPTSALGSLPVWAGVSVDGGPELAPRTKLQSVPFAFKALGAERLIIPGTFDSAVTVEPDGHVIVDGRVELGAAADAGGMVSVRNAADVQTVRLDGEQGSGAGSIEVFNGATSNVATVVLQGSDAADGRLDLFDSQGFQALRLHSDLTNGAPELSLFVQDTTLPLRETVQIQANFDASGPGAGEVRLRRVDPATQTAVTTVTLAATSAGGLGGMTEGGELILRHSDGNPVFTLHAGDGAGALSPTYMEVRQSGGDGRARLTPLGMTLYNTSNQSTIILGGNDGTATFDGEVSVAVLTITGGSDLSERFDIRCASGAVEPGMVVCIDPANPGALAVSGRAYDRTVAGVVSGAGGVKPGMLMSQSGTIADGKHPVALTGRVWVWCDASGAAIEPGDMLTTSDTPGHAMKAEDSARCGGASIGKAMTSLAAGQRGLVLVLVNLQ